MLNFTMRTCVPINANRLFLPKITPSSKFIIIFTLKFCFSLGTVETKILTTKMLAFWLIWRFILQNKAIEGVEVNGFVDVCAPTNKFVGFGENLR